MKTKTINELVDLIESIPSSELSRRGMSNRMSAIGELRDLCLETEDRDLTEPEIAKYIHWEMMTDGIAKKEQDRLTTKYPTHITFRYIFIGKVLIDMRWEQVLHIETGTEKYFRKGDEHIILYPDAPVNLRHSDSDYWLEHAVKEEQNGQI